MRIFKNWQGMVVTFVVLLVMFPVAAEAPAETRNYNNPYFFLKLDGVTVGTVKEFEGGGTYAEVINEPQGPDYFIKKHTGQLKYEDITIPAGPNMEPGFYKWMADAMENKAPRKSGSIITADRNYDFTNAFISEISFPELDGASKEPVYFTVKLKPENIKLNAAGSETGNSASSSMSSKKLIGSNFRLKIDGLSTNKIQKIDAITIKNEIVNVATGDEKFSQNQPGKLSIPNLVVTMSGDNDNAQSFINWYNDFMLNGNNGDSKEKSGTLEYLSAGKNDVMFRLKFEHLGIAKISRENRLPGDSIDKLKVEMYVEKILFEYPSAGSDSLGTIDSNDANKAEPQPSGTVPKTTQDKDAKAQTTPEPDTTSGAAPAIVTLTGKLTSSETNAPVKSGSLNVIIIDPAGEKVWQGTFNNAIEKGEFNIPLGAEKELILEPGTLYTAVVEIDAESSAFSKADVIFGDGTPAGDTIRFKV